MNNQPSHHEVDPATTAAHPDGEHTTEPAPERARRGVPRRRGLDRRHVRRLLRRPTSPSPLRRWSSTPAQALAALPGSVALRREPFGALVYYFATRKLSFLKSQLLVDVVAALDEHPRRRLRPHRSAASPRPTGPTYLRRSGRPRPLAA